MIINDINIAPGEDKRISIPIANLPAGTPIDLDIFVYRSRNPGPTMLVLGGVHGDEINGVEIVRRAIAEGHFNKLNIGSVIAIPLLNVFGFIQISREFPSGKDINRSFPGTKSGSLASRVAYTLREMILPHADFGIDFHTGGNMVYNHPQCRYYSDDADSTQLAKEMNMPFSVNSGLIKKSIRKTAFDKDVPMVVFEGGESSRIDEYCINEGLRGLKLVMNKRGFKSFKAETITPESLGRGTWQRAEKSGILQLIKKSGDTVKKGEIVGYIRDPMNTFEKEVKAIITGAIYGHNNNPLMNKGDAILHIAPII